MRSDALTGFGRGRHLGADSVARPSESGVGATRSVLPGPNSGTSRIHNLGGKIELPGAASFFNARWPPTATSRCEIARPGAASFLELNAGAGLDYWTSERPVAGGQWIHVDAELPHHTSEQQPHGRRTPTNRRHCMHAGTGGGVWSSGAASMTKCGRSKSEALRAGAYSQGRSLRNSACAASGRCVRKCFR